MEPGVFERCQRHAAQCDAGPGCPAAAYCQEGSAGTAVDRCRDCDPWYGQLMTTPQTIAWFVQLNYWLQKYRVELV